MTTTSIFNIVIVSLLSFHAVACGKENTPSPRASSSATTSAAPERSPQTHSAAQPGSYEDWCPEHAVPESLCTRCNPSLIAAFKATGDWCSEHDLPESQCKICNPDLKIERPLRREDGAK